jgi:CubicO group peptidase (beta-lactamase class C family)
MQAHLILDNNIQMKYSNIGYTLLGCLVEEVAGMPFDLYVQEKILAPLSLSDTGTDFRSELLPRLVTGYTRRNQQKERLPITENIDTRAMASATGFYSTAADMCKYFVAQFVGSGKLLTDESKKEMQRKNGV